MPDRTEVVIDASVSLAWLLNEPHQGSELQDLFLSAYRQKTLVLVPALWHWECANVLTGLVKRQAIKSAEVLHYLGLMRYARPVVDALPDVVVQQSTIEVAAGTGLSYYDASYVELAMRRKAALATFDLDMQQAAKGLGVTCLSL
jgi:predicted nucleic acid-binding protein